jgi:hypothetical protein
MAIEYYVSWRWYSWYACDMLPADLGGKRLAFTIGYNDRDSAGDTVTCLRWQHGDPWTPRAPGESHWGDLLLPQELVPLAAGDRPVHRVQPSNTPVRAERFTLSGKRIRLGTPARGLVAVESAVHPGSLSRVLLTVSGR